MDQQTQKTSQSPYSAGDATEVEKTNTQTGSVGKKKGLFRGAIVVLILLVLIFALAGGSAVWYFFFELPRQDRLETASNVEGQVEVVGDELATLDGEYKKLIQLANQFGEITEEDSEINAMLVTSQEEFGKEELGDFIGQREDFLDGLSTREFSSENEQELEELPQTGDLTFVEQVNIVQAVIDDTQNESEDLTKELKVLDEFVDDGVLTPSDLGDNYTEYREGVDTYQNSINEVLDFYEFSLGISEDYFNELVTTFENVEIAWISDDPRVFLEDFEENKAAYEDLLERLESYDESMVPQGLEETFQSNQETVLITLDFVDAAIAAIEDLDPVALYSAEEDFFNELLVALEGYDLAGAEDFWSDAESNDNINNLVTLEDKVLEDVDAFKKENQGLF